MLKRYMQFVKPYTMLIILTIIIGILKFGIPLLIPLLIKYVIDDVINNTSMSVAEKKKHYYKPYSYSDLSSRLSVRLLSISDSILLNGQATKYYTILERSSISIFRH